ncbi:MAG: DUF1835 domain-containing protein [Bacteroidetes bacterium]|nr:DUF1835 domain-containing protein [Bacteroidota bacterium]
MIHIIVGNEAAANLEAAFLLDENLRGEVCVLKDTLGIGPISVDDQIDHDALRSEFWKALIPQDDIVVTDSKILSALVERAIAEEEPLCFWLSPCVSDVCAYYWLLTYCKPYADLLHTINIIGLPFLNEKGQMFYPKNFSEIPPKEFLKTKRLLKNVTPAEYEVEGDEWSRLQSEQTWVRTYEGGKKIVSRDVTFYDSIMKASISADFQKGSKIINESLKKCPDTISNWFFDWRLRQFIEQGLVESKGDLTKGAKDFEVKKIGEPIPISEIAEGS